ncbi:MAG: hypothetical protein IPK12_13850 [Gemmatimonadetes bacterium]|nr:hypothetical protein [Gemmatimonadota bacterium]
MSATAPRRTAELFAAVFTAAGAILAYLLARPGVARWAGAPVGHLLGTVGLGLMLWAGFGYTWRKRSTAPGSPPCAPRCIPTWRQACWGRCW